MKLVNTYVIIDRSDNGTTYIFKKWGEYSDKKRELTEKGHTISTNTRI